MSVTWRSTQHTEIRNVILLVVTMTSKSDDATHTHTEREYWESLHLDRMVKESNYHYCHYHYHTYQRDVWLGTKHTQAPGCVGRRAGGGRTCINITSSCSQGCERDDTRRVNRAEYEKTTLTTTIIIIMTIKPIERLYMMNEYPEVSAIGPKSRIIHLVTRTIVANKVGWNQSIAQITFMTQ